MFHTAALHCAARSIDPPSNKAGIVLSSRVTSGQPNTSQGFELEVISACVLGGVSLTGGVGSMVFMIAGVLIMGIV